MENDPRHFTKVLLNMLIEGEVDSFTLTRNLLNWMSEAEVKEFYENNFMD